MLSPPPKPHEHMKIGKARSKHRLRSPPFVAKLARCDAERNRQTLQDVRRQIDQAALNFGHVRLIAVDELGKLLLGEANRLRLDRREYIRRKTLAERICVLVPGGNITTQSDLLDCEQRVLQTGRR
jgi:hypothetical protein